VPFDNAFHPSTPHDGISSPLMDFMAKTIQKFSITKILSINRPPSEKNNTYRDLYNKEGRMTL
jgi:hypothetical protein